MTEKGNITQQCFITFLKDYVHQKVSEEPTKEPDWDLLARYAEEQNLSGIVYYQCRNIKTIDNGALHKLKKGFLSDAYISVNSEEAYKSIQKEFGKNSIPYMPFKGAILSRYYPNQELRTMGDRDILIHHEDKETINEIMIGLGYNRYIDNHAVWTYIKPNLMFEIHNVMFYEDLSNQVNYREYFSRVWETALTHEVNGNSCFELEPKPETHFLYTMAHTAKHIINNGMGFRAFLDMVFYCRNATEIDGKEPDWEWIQRELKKIELFDFTETCFALCEHWFGVDMPFKKDALDTAFIEAVTDKTFRDGIFGFENEDNKGAKAAKEIKRSDKAYHRTALKLTIKKLFPPYEDMQLIPWYAWVDGKPYLMPTAWVYRWIYCLIHKGKKSSEYLLEPFQKRIKIEERKKYLEYWGL